MVPFPLFRLRANTFPSAKVNGVFKKFCHSPSPIASTTTTLLSPRNFDGGSPLKNVQIRNLGTGQSNSPISMAISQQIQGKVASDSEKFDDQEVSEKAKRGSEKASLPPQINAENCYFVKISLVENGRIPRILDSLISDTDKIYRLDAVKQHGEKVHSEINKAIEMIESLKNGMVTDKNLPKIASTVAEADLWNAAIDSAPSWKKASFLLTESLTYRKVWEAFERSEFLREIVDPYRAQKEKSFEQCISQAALGMGKEFLTMIDNTLDYEGTQHALLKLLQLKLWGNLCDLGLGTDEKYDLSEQIHEELEHHRHKILADDLDDAIDNHLMNLRMVNGQRRVDIVLDNAGLELFTDLCFTDFMLTKTLADRVVLHGKQFPWFVSDATWRDVDWLLGRLSTDKSPILRRLGARWREHLEKGLISFTTHQFWTTPLAHKRMPSEAPELYLELKNASFMLFKGDLNYRKLIDDRLWHPTTGFQDALGGFSPSPFLSLRTVKQEVITGLSPETLQKLQEKYGAEDKSWMRSGEYAVAQLFRGR